MAAKQFQTNGSTRPKSAAMAKSTDSKLDWFSRGARNEIIEDKVLGVDGDEARHGYRSHKRSNDFSSR